MRDFKKDKFEYLKKSKNKLIVECFTFVSLGCIILFLGIKYNENFIEGIAVVICILFPMFFVLVRIYPDKFLWSKRNSCPLCKKSLSKLEYSEQYCNTCSVEWGTQK